MVIPFSNTKLRVPQGFQSLLVGLSTEVLRSQPRNIHAFAADYFERLVQRRGQGQPNPVEQQAAQEDRFYNNKSFQEEYPVNDPEVNHAAIKIQANFRGHRARKDLEKIQTEQRESVTPDQGDLNFTRHNVEEQVTSPRSENEAQDDEFVPEQELTEEEKQEQERAAISIQARFRGFKARQTLTNEPKSAEQTPSDNQAQESETQRTPTPSSALRSPKTDRDRRDSPTFQQEDDQGENDDIDRPRLEREPTQLSEDFERHTLVPRDPDFDREHIEHNYQPDDDDMNDNDLEKAATRIQATFRGYKTRKELDTTGSLPQHQQDEEHLHHHDDSSRKVLSPSAEDNKVPSHETPVNEDDDTAAATKIQAAYRGYRTRKDLDK